MKIKSKQTKQTHEIDNNQWSKMVRDGMSRKYEIVDHSDTLFENIKTIESKNIKYYCQFIGSVRSGHTLVSQIINSHKDALISDELNATEIYQTHEGITREKMFGLIHKRAEWYFNGGSKTWINRYEIGQYQGKTKSPIVIGDKSCGNDTTRFGSDLFLNDYMNYIGKPFKFIWVIRDVVQHINGKQSLALRAKNEKYYTIESNIEQYASQKKIAEKIEKGHDVLRVYLEKLIENPREEIIRILNFLELDIYEEHIDVCSKFVFNKPHTHNVEWTDKQKELIKNI